MALEEFLRYRTAEQRHLGGRLRSPLMGDPIDVALYRAAPAIWKRVIVSGSASRLIRCIYVRPPCAKHPDGRIVSMIKGAPESIMAILQVFYEAGWRRSGNSHSPNAANSCC